MELRLIGWVRAGVQEGQNSVIMAFDTLGLMGLVMIAGRF